MDAPKIYCDGLFRVERICWKILEAFLFLSSNTLTYFQQIVHYTRNWVRICWKWILVLATLGFFKRLLKGVSKNVLYITENCTNSLLVSTNFDKYPPKKLCSFLEEKLLIWEYSPPIFLRVIIFMAGKSQILLYAESVVGNITWCIVNKRGLTSHGCILNFLSPFYTESYHLQD